MKRSAISSLVFFMSINASIAGTMGSIDSSYDFDGFYFGLGSGFTSIYNRDTFSTTRSDGIPITAGDPDNRYTYTGALFTGNVGYGRMMFDKKTYLGVKGSLYYTPLETTNETGFSTASTSTLLIIGNNTLTTKLNPIYNIDAVLGYEVIKHYLPFVEAGVSFADVKRSYQLKRTRTNSATPPTNVKYENDFSLGGYKTTYNVGAGLSYQPHENWFLSMEVVYNYLGKRSDSHGVLIPNTSTTETQSRMIMDQSSSMFLSVSYKPKWFA